MSEELICITCPIGCHLSIERLPEGKLAVSGNRCPRGIKYANEELLNPIRVVSATAAIDYSGIEHEESLAEIARIPVRTDAAYPKEGVNEVLAAIYALKVKLPIKRGTILLADFKGSGVNVIAARSLGLEALA